MRQLPERAKRNYSTALPALAQAQTECEANWDNIDDVRGIPERWATPPAPAASELPHPCRQAQPSSYTSESDRLWVTSYQLIWFRFIRACARHWNHCLVFGAFSGELQHYAWLVAFTYKWSAVLLRCDITEYDDGDTVTTEVHIPCSKDADDSLVFTSSSDAFSSLHQEMIANLDLYHDAGVGGVQVFDWHLEWVAVGRAKATDRTHVLSATRLGLPVTRRSNNINKRHWRADADDSGPGGNACGDGGCGGGGGGCGGGGVVDDGGGDVDHDVGMLDATELEEATCAVEAELHHGGDDGPPDADLGDADVAGAAAEEAAVVGSALHTPDSVEKIITHIAATVAELDAAEDTGSLDPLDGVTRTHGLLISTLLNTRKL